MILGDMGRLAKSKLVPKLLFLRVSKENGIKQTMEIAVKMKKY